jgi:hypothetical protein
MMKPEVQRQAQDGSPNTIRIAKMVPTTIPGIPMDPRMASIFVACQTIIIPSRMFRPAAIPQIVVQTGAGSPEGLCWVRANQTYHVHKGHTGIKKTHTRPGGMAGDINVRK